MTNLLRSIASRISGKSRSRSRVSNVGREETKIQQEPEQPGLYHINKDLSNEDVPSAERYDVDIVAIHGLNGTAFGTWTT